MALPKVSGSTQGKKKDRRKPQHCLATLGKHRRDRVPGENKPAIKRMGYFCESMVVFFSPPNGVILENFESFF
jgi:hypothetical protein